MSEGKIKFWDLGRSKAKGEFIAKGSPDQINNTMYNVFSKHLASRDISFDKVLSQSLNNRTELKTTHSTHFAGTTASKNGPRLQYRTPSQPSIDGNTVDVHRERSEFIQNAIMYQTSLRFVSGRVSGLMSAIRGE